MNGLGLALHMSHTDLAHHTIHTDLTHHMTRIDDLARHMIRTDLVHHMIRTDLVHHMVCVTDGHVGTTIADAIWVMIPMRMNGLDVVHVFGRLVDIARTVTMSTTGLALTLQNIAGFTVHTLHTEVAHGIRDWVTGTLMRILVPVLLNTWTDFAVHSILLGVPVM